jgi:hypothetical protein
MAGTDPVTGLQPTDPCWCRSGNRYDACHGNPEPRSQPGEPILHEDHGDVVYLSPGYGLELGWLARRIAGQPVYAPSPEPVQRPEQMASIVLEIAERPASPAFRFLILDVSSSRCWTN